jgi:hypothetical protein
MLQFYFLSILLNALIGFFLFFEDESSSPLFKSEFFEKNGNTRFVLGILSALTCLLKILSPIEGDVLIIGDIIPAGANFLCGFVLIFEHFRNRSSTVDSDEDSKNKNKFRLVLLHNKKIIGTAAVIAAVLHFLFPKVLLL